MKKHLRYILTLYLTLAFLLALMHVAFAAEIVAAGECGAEGNNLAWTLDSNGVLTIGGTGAMMDYEFENDIPWKDLRRELTKVVIGDGVTSIGSNAFHSCTCLTDVKIPSSVNSIGNFAFCNCTLLKSIHFPESVTVLSTGVLELCQSLESFEIHNTVTSIGNSAFSGCESLKELYIPESVTQIDNYAFEACRSLTEIKIPYGVTSLAQSIFINCSGLRSVYIPDGVTDISGWAFYGCENLEIIHIPESVTDIGFRSFYGCEKLKDVTIPGSVGNIGGYSFAYCYGLKSVSIQEGVKNIDSGAFAYCYSLKSLAFPTSLRSIGDIFVQDVSGLVDVYYAGSEAQWEEISVGIGNGYLYDAVFHYSSTGPVIPKTVDDTLPIAQRYVPYSTDISALLTDSNFQLEEGSLPAGLSLSANGIISGMATEIGGFSFSVTEVSGSDTVTHNVTMFVYTQSALDVEANNASGYGFVETAEDNGRVKDQIVTSSEELTDQTMHCEAAYSEFRGLYLDARMLTRGVDYTAEEGSTKITISDETIGSAGGGTHTLAAEFVTSAGEHVYTVQNYTIAGIASKEVHVTVEGETVLWTDAEPYIDTNNRTMTPFRAVGEALGLSVAWDSSTREASFTDGAKTIYFPIGSTTARTSDGGTVTMDTSAVIVNGRTYAPIRYLAEFFGWGVSWDGKTRTAAIG